MDMRLGAPDDTHVVCFSELEILVNVTVWIDDKCFAGRLTTDQVA